MNRVTQTFFRLTKIDPFTGLCSGICTAEEVDRDNEILDYNKSKPYFVSWSNSVYKDSKGRSYGNVRFMHNDQRPVGILVAPLSFDDAAKTISVTARIVEPEAKDMLAAGILTGFSIGGQYVAKTPRADGTVAYVANPSELSVVDRPCLSNATFSVVKRDGSTELRKFRQPTEQELVKMGMLALAEAVQKVQTRRVNPNARIAMGL